MRGAWIFRRLWDRIRLWPPSGCVRWGSLRRTSPISRVFGLDRGQAIDRYYIERFLTARSAQIRGVVLEIGDDRYTKRFGGPRVTRSEVLHAIAGNPTATLIGDLQTGQGVPPDAFDCIILTQTLQFLYDMKAAVQTLHRCLRPGGVVLATGTGISQISRYDMDRWGDYWRFTSLSARRMFEEVFGPGAVTVRSYGNVLAATALLQGISANELKSAELDVPDQDYEVVITIEAVKRG
jgi:SAM-dependent methyltransferase